MSTCPNCNAEVTECPTCHGSGSAPAVDAAADSTCTTCNGSGLVEAHSCRG